MTEQDEEKLLAGALKKTEALFRRISENPQGGGVTLENSSDNLAVLYRALLREKAAREKAENKLKDSVVRMEAAERCSARWMEEWDEMKEERNKAEAKCTALREKVKVLREAALLVQEAYDGDDADEKPSWVNATLKALCITEEK